MLAPQGPPSAASNPTKRGRIYRTVRALPKPDISSATDTVDSVSLAKMEICAIPLAVAGSNPAVDRLPTRRRRTSPKLTSDRRAQPEIADGIFLFESAVIH